MESSIKENPIAYLKRPLNTKIYVSQNRHIIIAKNRYKGTHCRCGNSFDEKNVIKLYSWISTHTSPFFHIWLHMDRKILRDIRKILDRKNMEQNGENGMDYIKCQIANLETDVERVVEMMEKSDENTKKCFQQMMDLLKQVQEENQRYHVEVTDLKIRIRSYMKPTSGSSSPESSKLVDLPYEKEDVENDE